jgi:hypothetical protein
MACHTTLEGSLPSFIWVKISTKTAVFAGSYARSVAVRRLIAGLLTITIRCMNLFVIYATVQTLKRIRIRSRNANFTPLEIQIQNKYLSRNSSLFRVPSFDWVLRMVYTAGTDGRHFTNSKCRTALPRTNTARATHRASPSAVRTGKTALNAQPNLR